MNMTIIISIPTKHKIPFLLVVLIHHFEFTNLRNTYMMSKY